MVSPLFLLSLRICFPYLWWLLPVLCMTTIDRLFLVTESWKSFLSSSLMENKWFSMKIKAWFLFTTKEREVICLIMIFSINEATWRIWVKKSSESTNNIIKYKQNKYNKVVFIFNGIYCIVLGCDVCDKSMRKFPESAFHTTVLIWVLWCQKQVSQAGISNCIPQYSVGCNYLSMPEIPASGTWNQSAYITTSDAASDGKVVTMMWWTFDLVLLKDCTYTDHASLFNVKHCFFIRNDWKFLCGMLFNYQRSMFWIQIMFSCNKSLFLVTWILAQWCVMARNNPKEEMINIIIPIEQWSCWGVYWFHSVRPSVRPSVPPAVSAL